MPGSDLKATYAKHKRGAAAGLPAQALRAVGRGVVAEFARACQRVVRSGQNDCAQYRLESLGRCLEARIMGDPEGLSVYLRDVSEQHADEEARLVAIAQQTQRAERQPCSTNNLAAADKSPVESAAAGPRAAASCTPA